MLTFVARFLTIQNEVTSIYVSGLDGDHGM